MGIFLVFMVRLVFQKTLVDCSSKFLTGQWPDDLLVTWPSRDATNSAKAQNEEAFK